MARAASLSSQPSLVVYQLCRTDGPAITMQLEEKENVQRWLAENEAENPGDDCSDLGIRPTSTVKARALAAATAVSRAGWETV